MRFKAGAIVLSAWATLNLIVAGVVTAWSLAEHRPLILHLLFDDREGRTLDPQLIAVINAQALLANPTIAALCAIMLVVIWKGLVREARWAFFTLAGTLVPLQIFGYVSDSMLGNRNLVANVISTLVVLTGLSLSRPAVRQTAAPTDTDVPLR